MKSHRLSNKTASGRYGNLPFEFSINEVKENSKLISVVAIVFSFLPELESKPLLLKTTQISDTGLGGIGQEQT